MLASLNGKRALTHPLNYTKLSCLFMEITLTELEQAINYWRSARPSTGEERALSPEVNTLANVYALMIFSHARTVALDTLDPAAQQLLQTWRQQNR